MSFRASRIRSPFIAIQKGIYIHCCMYPTLSIVERIKRFRREKFLISLQKGQTVMKFAGWTFIVDGSEITLVNEVRDAAVIISKCSFLRRPKHC